MTIETQLRVFDFFSPPIPDGRLFRISAARMLQIKPFPPFDTYVLSPADCT